jgi:uncharacterized delta-60 repeat protein
MRAWRNLLEDLAATPGGGETMKIPAAAMLAAFAMLPAQRVFAGAGALDPGFGEGGFVVLPNFYPASPFDSGAKVLIQDDGKILVIGRAGGDASGIWRSAFLAVRLNPDGSLDTSFGPDHDGYFIFPWGGVPAEAHAALIDPNGDIVIGGNEGHRAGVVWLHPDGTFDAAQGPEGNGTANFAVNDDDSHTTALNAMIVEQPGNGRYILSFGGTYDGAGFAQMMLGSYVNPGPYQQVPAGHFVQTIVPPETNGNGVITSMMDDNGSAIYAGYAQSPSGSTQCVVGRATGEICHIDDDDNFDCGWFPDTAWGNEGAFVDQFFSDEFSSAAPCYVDAMMRPPGTPWTVAAGREFFGGGTRAVYFTLDAFGGLVSPFFKVFAITPWGDNSPREVLAQRDGKWLLAGFSGADLSGISDPVVARVRVIDGALDSSFGNGGVSLLYFDPQDYAHGEAFGAALDAHGCIVSVGTYYNGTSDEGGRDISQIFVSRVLGDSGGAGDTIFRDGFDPATALCGA